MPAPAAEAHPLRTCGAIGTASALAALVVRLIVDFDHGIWLIAYLALVGALAPLLLSAGERRFVTSSRDPGEARAVAWLWSAGVALVPAGVLSNARILVCFGAIALLVALALLTRRAYAPGGRRLAPILVAQTATIAVMVASTAIGVLLAWDYPWV